MPRHPLPAFQKRRITLFGCAFVGIALLGMLVKASFVRRELIRQQLAWRVPENSAFLQQAKLTLSADGKRLTCRFPSQRVKFDDWTRTFNTRTGDVVEDKPAPKVPLRATVPSVESQVQNGVRVWLPGGPENARQLRLNRNGRSSTLALQPLTFSGSNHPQALRLSPDASRLTVLGRSAVWNVDLNNQRIVSTVRPIGRGRKNRVWSKDENCTLSPDGNFIITLTPRPTLYNAHTGRKIRSVGAALETMCGGCGCIEPGTGFSPDAKLMWASEDAFGGGNVAFWRVDDGRKVWQRVLGEWEFDPTGKYIISPSAGAVFSTVTGKVVCRLPMSDFFDSFICSNDGRHLYILNQDGRIRHYRLP